MTLPAPPSTVIICPLWMRRVATPVVEHGRYAILTGDDGAVTQWAADAVTTAEAMAKSGDHAGVVVPATSTSPGII